jgi:hypothetical protein
MALGQGRPAMEAAVLAPRTQLRGRTRSRSSQTAVRDLLFGGVPPCSAGLQPRHLCFSVIPPALSVVEGNPVAQFANGGEGPAFRLSPSSRASPPRATRDLSLCRGGFTPPHLAPVAPGFSPGISASLRHLRCWHPGRNHGAERPERVSCAPVDFTGRRVLTPQTGLCSAACFVGLKYR